MADVPELARLLEIDPYLKPYATDFQRRYQGGTPPLPSACGRPSRARVTLGPLRAVPPPSRANHAVGVAPASRRAPDALSVNFLLHVFPVRAQSPAARPPLRAGTGRAGATQPLPGLTGHSLLLGVAVDVTQGRVSLCHSNFVVYFRAAFGQSFGQTFNTLHPSVCSYECINLPVHFNLILIVDQICISLKPTSKSNHCDCLTLPPRRGKRAWLANL